MSFDPQVQHLIDSGAITPEQARAAAESSPAANEVAGFVRCLNEGCELFDESVPVRFVRHVTYHRAQGLPLIESSSVHLSAVDDADLLCGSCARPCAIQETMPPVYPRQMTV